MSLLLLLIKLLTSNILPLLGVTKVFFCCWFKWEDIKCPTMSIKCIDEWLMFLYFHCKYSQSEDPYCWAQWTSLHHPRHKNRLCENPSYCRGSLRIGYECIHQSTAFFERVWHPMRENICMLNFHCSVSTLNPDIRAFWKTVIQLCSP